MRPTAATATCSGLIWSYSRFVPYAERVWALRHNLTSYDAWYVALAETFDCPLLTLDRKISRASGLTCKVIAPP